MTPVTTSAAAPATAGRAAKEIRGFWAWSPALVLGLGVLASAGFSRQLEPSLRAPLASVVSPRLAGVAGKDMELTPEEKRTVGMTNYLYRFHAGSAPGARPIGFSLYVGYYASQTHGATIHSPKNCLPGSGWQPLSSTTETVQVGDRSVRVNRYLLERRGERALVLYWYQGRGRVESNEYRVKWELLRDAILHRRSEEAVIRLFVWLPNDERAALALSKRVAAEVIPMVDNALPTRESPWYHRRWNRT